MKPGRTEGNELSGEQARDADGILGMIFLFYFFSASSLFGKLSGVGVSRLRDVQRSCSLMRYAWIMFWLVLSLVNMGERPFSLVKKGGWYFLGAENAFATFPARFFCWRLVQQGALVLLMKT